MNAIILIGLRMLESDDLLRKKVFRRLVCRTRVAPEADRAVESSRIAAGPRAYTPKAVRLDRQVLGKCGR